MKNYPHLSARVLNTPLLVEPGYARVFFSALASRLGIVQLSDAEGEILTGEKLQVDLGSFGGRRDQSESRSYPVYNGVAVLPVSGSLVHKSGHLNPYSGMTGYDGIIARAANAFADPDVKGVLMDKDTPGGEVSGCFDTARTLRQLADASGKQLWSLCHDMHCSAGMALASSAHRRLITQTGVAGSVGVVMAHTNVEKMLGENGVEVTLIHSGQHKVDGNPYESLSADVLAKFQAGTDNIRQMFAQLMADHMGLSVEAILATEAATYTGQAAVDVGFADELINGNEAIHYFSEYLAGRGQTITIGSKTMSTNTNEPEQGGTPPVQDQKTKADQQEPKAEQTPPQQPVKQSAQEPAGQQQADAGAAMQARIGGILGLDAAASHPKTAHYLAFQTALTVEQAEGILATLPEASTQQQMGNALDRLMDKETQPDIGADTGEPPKGNALLADYELVTGDKG